MALVLWFYFVSSLAFCFVVPKHSVAFLMLLVAYFYIQVFLFSEWFDLNSPTQYYWK